MSALESVIEKFILSPSFTHNNVEYYPVYYALIALNIFLLVGGIIACNRCRSRNSQAVHTESSRKAKPKDENKETVPLVRKTSYSSESSVIDIASEADSDASEKSIRSDPSMDYAHASDFSECLEEKLRSHHKNGCLFEENLRNPYSYQLHTVESYPVAKQNTSTQTERETRVAKKTFCSVSTQVAGKKSSSTQTANGKKHVDVRSPERPKHPCLGDKKLYKVSKAVLDADHVEYIQNHPGNFAFAAEKAIHGKSYFPVEQRYSQEVDEPSNRNIFGVALKHVGTP